MKKEILISLAILVSVIASIALTNPHFFPVWCTPIVAFALAAVAVVLGPIVLIAMTAGSLLGYLAAPLLIASLVIALVVSTRRR